MERELWPVLYRLVRQLGRDFHQKHVQIQPWILVACSLWAILHDRTAQWACDQGNWQGACSNNVSATAPSRPWSPSSTASRCPSAVTAKTPTPATAEAPAPWTEATNCTPSGRIEPCPRPGKS